MNENESRQELLQIVDRLVEELLAAAGVDEPPVNAITLAQQHLGLQIVLDRRPQRRAGKRSVQESVIVLSPDASPEQQQWTVAHEIGRRHKADLLRRLNIDPQEARGLAGPSLANLLAERLLVPSHFLAGVARSLAFDVLELKKRFSSAAPELIAWRLLDLPEPCIISVIDNDHVQRRRSNAWQVRKELSGPEQRCQQYVHSYSRPQLLREDGWTIQGWPVHQADWKREILRSVMPDE